MVKKVFFALSITTLLAACGYKGALYLPKNAPAPSNPANNQYAPNTNQGESQARKSLLPALLIESANESAINESGMLKSKLNESANTGHTTNT